MRDIIARRIVELRKRYDLTQKELADKLGFKPSAISGWESGSRVPETLTLVKMCNIFGMKIGWFFYEDNIEELNPYALIIADAKAKKITARQLQSLLDALGKQ